MKDILGFQEGGIDGVLVGREEKRWLASGSICVIWLEKENVICKVRDKAVTTGSKSTDGAETALKED